MPGLGALGAGAPVVIVTSEGTAGLIRTSERPQETQNADTAAATAATESALFAGFMASLPFASASKAGARSSI